MVLILYAVSDGPPSLAVRMGMKLMNIDYKLINISFNNGEHLTPEYAEKNPQKEIPVLDDDGFYLSESNAILQYLADKYNKDPNIYPDDPKDRALVNHRLCFNLASYYSAISGYTLAPIFFDYQRDEMGLKRTKIVLDVFNTYLKRLGKKYAASDALTIADLQLITATMCLEVIDFDLTPYPLVQQWYNTFKQEYPHLWAIAEEGMHELIGFHKNPPKLNMIHPVHPIRK